MHQFIPFAVFAVVAFVFVLMNKKFGDKLFCGNIIKDYGVIEERQQGITNVKHSLLLTEKDGVRRIMIKEEMSAVLGWNLRYFEFDLGSAQKLRDGLTDALKS